MKKFIVKRDASCYYLINESMGCAGEQQGHPSYTFSIIEKRGGHVVGSSAILPSNLHSSHLPMEVKDVIKNLLQEFSQSNITSVNKYMY